MFPGRYFPQRMFASRYWAKVGATAIDVRIDPPYTATWLDPARTAAWDDPAREATWLDPARTATWE